MKVSPSTHLTYCTNIHPGEHWAEVWESLRAYTLPLKERLAAGQDFGIGLRLSNIASQEIMEGGQLVKFKEWLGQNGLYVFTLNGFPYGGFHRKAVKDNVHQPDWSTTARLEYTRRSFDILAYLLPEGVDGGISTSPLSYRHWFAGQPAKLAETREKGCRQLAEIAAHLARLKAEKGVQLHLDIEPEPDGLLENTQEVVDFYQKHLIPIGSRHLESEWGISKSRAEALLYEHIQVCYDICHFAVVYEDPEYTFRAWKKAGIKVGKVQVSAALKAIFPDSVDQRGPIVEAFEGLKESTYLHQVVARRKNSTFQHYNDLPEALLKIHEPDTVEWRTHFHVPVFVDTFGPLSATREAIEKVLRNHRAITNHWEVETYTWEVLPEEIRFGLLDSIEREMRWVLTSL